MEDCGILLLLACRTYYTMCPLHPFIKNRICINYVHYFLIIVYTFANMKLCCQLVHQGSHANSVDLNMGTQLSPCLVYVNLNLKNKPYLF